MYQLRHETYLGLMLLQQHQFHLKVVLQQLKNKKKWKKKIDRNIWVRQWICRRPDLGLYHRLMVELRREDPKAFKNFMRMPPNMFDEIVERLTPSITKTTTKWRDPLEPGLKVAITLRHLAAGTKYKEMQYAWRVPANSISIVVREVCVAIIAMYRKEQLKVPKNASEWREITDDWLKRWNLPHVIGAIDGKHIACKAPPNTGSDYFNYKGFFSIILLAVCTSDYKFLWIDTSGKGSSSDAHIYNNSELQMSLQNDDIVGFPQPDPLPCDTQDIPYFLVGDDAFALRPYLMKPFGCRKMTRKQRMFNYRLSRARRVIENSFGILANRFQVLLTTMMHHVDTVRLVVKTCVILHNLMRSRYPNMQNKMLDLEKSTGNVVPGAWREGINLEDANPQAQLYGHNKDFKIAKAQRNLLMEWCNSSAGKVPWQDDMLLPRCHKY